MSICRKFTIVVRGDNDTDYEQALQEALSRITEGNLAGGDRNESGAFYFDSTEEVPEADQPA